MNEYYFITKDEIERLMSDGAKADEKRLIVLIDVLARPHNGQERLKGV